MKCCICNQEIEILNVIDLFTKQSLCNNCNKLFKYHKKNVRIKGTRLQVNYFSYHKEIMVFFREKYLVKYNEYLFKKNRKNNVIVFDNLDQIKIGKDQKEIIFFYCRDDYKQMIKKIVTFAYNHSKKMKIICYELIK